MVAPGPEPAPPPTPVAADPMSAGAVASPGSAMVEEAKRKAAEQAKLLAERRARRAAQAKARKDAMGKAMSPSKELPNAGALGKDGSQPGSEEERIAEELARMR